MKKILSFIMVLVLCLSLCACKDNTAELEGKIAALEQEVADLKAASTDSSQCPAEYVGEWITVSSAVSISSSSLTMQLHDDGTGSLTDNSYTNQSGVLALDRYQLGNYTTDLTWHYNKKYNTIEVEIGLFNSSGSFLVKETDGKTILIDTGAVFGTNIYFFRSADLAE